MFSNRNKNKATNVTGTLFPNLNPDANIISALREEKRFFMTTLDRGAREKQFVGTKTNTSKDNQFKLKLNQPHPGSKHENNLLIKY